MRLSYFALFGFLSVYLASPLIIKEQIDLSLTQLQLQVKLHHHDRRKGDDALWNMSFAIFRQLCWLMRSSIGGIAVVAEPEQEKMQDLLHQMIGYRGSKNKLDFRTGLTLQLHRKPEWLAREVPGIAADAANQFSNYLEQLRAHLDNKHTPEVVTARLRRGSRKSESEMDFLKIDEMKGALLKEMEPTPFVIGESRIAIYRRARLIQNYFICMRELYWKWAPWALKPKNRRVVSHPLDPHGPAVEIDADIEEYQAAWFFGWKGSHCEYICCRKDGKFRIDPLNCFNILAALCKLPDYDMMSENFVMAKRLIEKINPEYVAIKKLQAEVKIMMGGYCIKARALIGARQAERERKAMEAERCFCKIF